MEAINGETDPDLPVLLSPTVQNAARVLSLVAIVTIGLLAYGSIRNPAPTDNERRDPTGSHHASPIFQIDINLADQRELTMMPGIGELTANRILQDRDQNGPFATLDDLTRVPGVGPKTVRDIRPYCVVASR